MAKKHNDPLEVTMLGFIGRYGIPEVGSRNDKIVLREGKICMEWKGLASGIIDDSTVDPIYRLRLDLNDFRWRHLGSVGGRYAIIVAYAVWMGAVIYPDEGAILFPSVREVRTVWYPLAALAIESNDASTKVVYDNGVTVYLHFILNERNYCDASPAKYTSFRNQREILVNISEDIPDNIRVNINGSEVMLIPTSCSIITYEGDVNPVYREFMTTNLYMKHTGTDGSIQWIPEL